MLHVHGGLGEGVMAVGKGGKEVAQSPAGPRLGLGRGTDFSAIGGPGGVSDASDFPQTTLDTAV